MPNSVGATPRSAAPRRSNAARLFGYDIFISFALGLPPRGTHSYASDLARRLRELDFTVFFSEDEAPVGNQLNSTLLKALLRSHALVIVANREMLDDPRWVRTEVEKFSKAHPRRPIIPIFVGKVLPNDALMKSVREWLPYEGNIWVDESVEAVGSGIVSETAVKRLATAPRFRKANRRWRLTVSAVMVGLVALAVSLFLTNRDLEIAVRAQTALRLNAEAQAILSGARSGGSVRGLLKLLAAYQIEPHIEIEDAMLAQMVACQNGEKIIEIDTVIYAVAFSPDGTHLISGDADGTLQLWEARTGKPIGTPWKGHASRVTSVAYSPNGTRLISADFYGTLRQWEAQTGKPVGTPWKGHASGGGSVVYSPDGTRLISGSADGTIQLWDAQTGKPVGTPWKGHASGVTSVAYSPDRTHLVSCSWNSFCQLWEAQTGKPVGTPWKGHKDVTSVAYSSDGTHLISGGADGTFQLWEAQTGKPVGPSWKGHASRVTSVAYSLDGTRVVSQGDTETIQWPAPKAWPNILCAKLTHNMSRKEWREQVSLDIEYDEQCPGLPIPPDEPTPQPTRVAAGETE